MTPATRRRVSFVVAGLAQPKGSARAFVVRRAQGPPRAVVTSDNTRARGWQELVAAQAQTVAAGGFFLGAVVLAVTFYLPRPTTLPRKIRHHTTKPDVDKLVRLVGDALTGVLFLDDKQIVELHARKVYAAYPDGPHATITLEAADPLPDVADVALGSPLFDHA